MGLSVLGLAETISMALSSKLGSFVRQTSLSSMLNHLRYMSSSKLFVGGLSYGTDDMSLKDAFSEYGEVVEARVIHDRDTGRSRGFGFVSYGDSESASTALNSMDGKELQGRNIRVSYANDRPSVPRNFGSNPRGNSSSYGNRDDDY